MRDDRESANRIPMSPETLEGQPVLLFVDQRSWESWLEANQVGPGGVWLKISKRGSVVRSVSYAEALESAICFGWIDARKMRYDDSCFLQRFTPRRSRSIWSKINQEKALELIDSGRMRPAGQKAIDEARANGQWDAAYASASTATVPVDFQALLDSNAEARAFFATLTGTNRYAILYRIQTAKKPETRAKRMAKFIEMLNKHDTIYPNSRTG